MSQSSSTMSQPSSFLSRKRYAVVTGANKGNGFGISNQLASNGVHVMVTARDVNKGMEALQKLKDLGLADYVIFHQLDVTDSQSIASLADFVKSHFGNLDILVNNAGANGAIIRDRDAFISALSGVQPLEQLNWSGITSQPLELAEECLRTNYYGVKQMTESLLPLLRLSDSPRIVNVSSITGQLTNVNNEWAKKVLSDVENLTEEKIDEVLNVFIKDLKEGSSPSSKGWNAGFAAYYISKAAVNAYTRFMAKQHPSVCINCVCPGLVKTDLIANTGFLSVDEGAESPVKLALMPNNGPSGLFFIRQQVSTF